MGAGGLHSVGVGWGGGGALMKKHKNIARW